MVAIWCLLCFWVGGLGFFLGRFLGGSNGAAMVAVIWAVALVPWFRDRIMEAIGLGFGNWIEL